MILSAENKKIVQCESTRRVGSSICKRTWKSSPIKLEWLDISLGVKEEGGNIQLVGQTEFQIQKFGSKGICWGSTHGIIGRKVLICEQHILSTKSLVSSIVEYVI